eukprot:TRINITY_DN20483_c0_g1_i1.p1 TRINITY_DN20483_c0_g1~~TRINITY_DN20483_c0_g1_i1.p1  ORF type:complete len:303 (+),score=45.43 TRINITY_DN20483_c0_g1_i1:3-911(+)
MMLSLAAAVMMSQCAPATAAELYPPGETTSGSLVHDGVTRTFLVFVPSRPSGSMPLVMMFHGGYGTAEHMSDNYGMSAVGEREGFAVVYAQGLGRIATWNAGGCCGYAVREQVDDVGFSLALIDHLAGNIGVNRSRVYAAGHSNGGLLAYRLGCEQGGVFAGVGPVAASLEVEPGLCGGGRVVPVVHVHGTQDLNIPWEGGPGCGTNEDYSYRGPARSVEAWRQLAGCSSNSSVVLRQGNGECAEYLGCAAGSSVVLCRIEGGGHSWPGSEPPRSECDGSGEHSTSFNASQVLWDFFSGLSL